MPMNFTNPIYNRVVCFRALARRNVNPQNASFSCKLSLLSLTKRSRKARNRMAGRGRVRRCTHFEKSLCWSRPGCIISSVKVRQREPFHPPCRLRVEMEPQNHCRFLLIIRLFIFDRHDIDANLSHTIDDIRYILFSVFRRVA